MRRFPFLAALLLAVLAPGAADAFCGFYVSGADGKLFNDATQVVLMREGTRTVLSMANNYNGPPEDFAMVVPVPVVLQKANVKTLPREIFDHVDQLTSPRLVEYWEQDPCPKAMPYPEETQQPMPAAPEAREEALSTSTESHGVKIEARFSVGEYDILILSARDSGGLDTWLHERRYKIPDGAEPLLRPYVQEGMKFFVAKVNLAKVQKQTIENRQVTMLSPLRFHYDSDAFMLPIRLGLVNSAGTQDLIVEVLAKNQRYEVANYDNVAIPTNLDVAEGARDKFGSMYAALFDATVARHPRAVVTEYSWQASSCDPCPGPVLAAEDLATLGADAMWDEDEMAGKLSDFVVTRLHMRYSREVLGDDLYFRTAPPIQGGREVPGNGSTLEQGVVNADYNNFQARYAIRHPWTGPIECANPRRGVWGGPPGNPYGVQTRPATNIAFVPRGGVDLAALVKTPIPETGALSSGGPTPPFQVPPAPGGCAGCAAASGGDDVAAGILGVLGLTLFTRRRRRNVP
jgi:MYXO-CTERM domain-containing protein